MRRMEIQPSVAWAAGCERLALVVHRPGESGHIRGRGCAVQVKPGIQIQSCHVSFAPGGGRAQGGRCKGEALFSTLSVWRAVDSNALCLPVCSLCARRSSQWDGAPTTTVHSTRPTRSSALPCRARQVRAASSGTWGPTRTQGLSIFLTWTTPRFTATATRAVAGAGPGR